MKQTIKITSRTAVKPKLAQSKRRSEIERNGLGTRSKETDRQTDRHRHEGEGGLLEVPIHPTQGGTPEERNRDETLDWHGQKERAREKGECQCAHKVGTYGRREREREREKDRKKDIQREWRGTAHRRSTHTPTYTPTHVHIHQSQPHI